MDLHLYDDREYRYSHTDLNQSAGRAVVARLLHLAEPPSLDGLLYELSFYSGGIGVLDHLAIALPANQKLWADVVAALKAKTPEEASQDGAWVGDFLWLLTMEDVSITPRIAAVQFINSERRTFQAQCHSAQYIFFAHGSDVNDWVALWGDETLLNYLGYSQG